MATANKELIEAHEPSIKASKEGSSKAHKSSIETIKADSSHDAPICDCNVVHEEAVAKVLSKIADSDMIVWTADLFKVLGDPTRLKIVAALMIEELCVCDIAAIVDMTQPAVSHHLAKLRQARLVKFRRNGKMIVYSLDDEHVEVLLRQGLSHADHRR